MAFLMGSLAPAVIGWMNDHMSMRTGFASLGWFYLVGALVLVPALVRFFWRDYIGDEEKKNRKAQHEETFEDAVLRNVARACARKVGDPEKNTGRL
jgi:hypothetical protein